MVNRSSIFLLIIFDGKKRFGRNVLSIISRINDDFPKYQLMLASSVDLLDKTKKDISLYSYSLYVKMAIDQDTVRKARCVTQKLLQH
jgi:hypothetical protein